MPSHVFSKILAAAAAALAFATVRSYAAPADAPSPDNTADAQLIASAKPAIDAVNADWLPALRRRDAKAIAAAYADNGVFVSAGGESVVGREAIEQLYRARIERIHRVVGGDIVQEGMATSGGLIYEWGHASLDTEQADGTHTSGGGGYLTVWQRDAHGVWRIVRNLVLPPTAPQPNPASGDGRSGRHP